jgi:hypothetical protein
MHPILRRKRECGFRGRVDRCGGEQAGVDDLALRLFLLSLSLALLLGMSGAVLALAHSRARAR